MHVQYTDTSVLTVWVEPRTGRIVDLRWTETVLATLTGTQVGTVPLDRPVASAASALPAAAASSAGSAARRDLSLLDRRSGLIADAEAAGTVAVIALLGTVFLLLTGCRDRRAAQPAAAVTHITPDPAPAAENHR